MGAPLSNPWAAKLRQWRAGRSRRAIGEEFERLCSESEPWAKWTYIGLWEIGRGPPPSEFAAIVLARVLRVPEEDVRLSAQLERLRRQRPSTESGTVRV